MSNGKELQTLILELRTFIVGTEARLDNIERHLKNLTGNSKDLENFAISTGLFKQRMEQAWKFHHADHENLAEDMKSMNKKLVSLWQYILIAVVSGVAGGPLLSSLKGLIANIIF